VGDSLRGIATKVVLSLFSIGLSLLLIEVGMRLLLPQPKFDTRLPYYPYMNRTVETDLNGVTPISNFTTNSWGFRGEEPPDDWDEHFTIVTVGGSTTISQYLDDENVWTALLEDSLQEDYEKTWVGNAGIDGHSSRGNVLVMEQVIRDVQPDLVVILVGVNDLGLSLSPDGSIYSTTFDEDEAPILFKSPLFRFAWLMRNVLLGDVVTSVDAHDNYDPIPVDPDELSELPDDLSEALPQLPIFEENINTIIDIADKVDVDVLFLTQPLLYDDSKEWEGVLGETPWIAHNITITGATYWQLLEVYDHTLLDICEERGAYCYDLAEQVPHDWDYFYDIAHFTDAGSAKVASEVEIAIREMILEQ